MLKISLRAPGKVDMRELEPFQGGAPYLKGYENLKTLYFHSEAV